MAAPSAREKRAARQARNGNLVDMNLVSLIDVFTILIFFLLSSAAGVETLISPKAVKLPEAQAEQAPRDAVVLVVSGDEILLDGRRVALVAQVLADAADTVPALQDELATLAQRQALLVEPGTNKPRSPARVTLLADKDMPYRLLRKLMASCAAAGFGDLQFAVRRKEGA
jgi:biopolymer transport protein TolR